MTSPAAPRIDSAKSSTEGVDTRPDILMIVADDLGYADLSCFGQTDFATPSLDRLAADGVRFTQAYANAPLCTNTRVALITGRYQYRFTLGLTEPLRYPMRHRPDMGLPPEHPTLPGLLRDAGYSTALVGKWHLGSLPRFGPLKSGYESFYGVMGGYTGYFTHLGDGGEHDFYEGETEVHVNGYVTDLLSDRAVQTIREARADKPLFLSLHYTAPHWPWSAPSVAAAARERELDPKRNHDGGSPRIYAEMVTVMDAGIGRVLDALKARGRERNTLVLFTSDNGGERYSKIWPFVGRKRDLLEGGLRVPQIACWPARVPPGRVSDQVTISMDLTATALDAAGVAMPAETPLDGVSLLPQLTGAASDVERTLFWRMKERGQRAVRSGQWKYLKVREQEFLFDLDYDWRERTNFAADEPALLADLRARWEAWDRTMLPVPEEAALVTVDLSSWLW
jgi:arylsulfatase A-like enzyme